MSEKAKEQCFPTDVLKTTDSKIIEPKEISEAAREQLNF